MAYPNYGYNNYGYIPGYAPGYTQPQYATNPYQNMQPVQTQAVPNTVIPPTTNKRLCISQEDAMSRQVENNSSYVYFDQNKDIMYEVNTDAWGKKTCNVYSLAVYKNPEVAEVPKESFEDLSKRISQLPSMMASGMPMVPEVLILIWNKLWKQQKLSESGLKTLTKENFV